MMELNQVEDLLMRDLLTLRCQEKLSFKHAYETRFQRYFISRCPKLKASHWTGMSQALGLQK